MLKIYAQSNFQVHNIVSLTIITVCVLPPWNLFVLQLQAGALWPTSSTFPTPNPGNHQTTLCFFNFDFKNKLFIFREREKEGEREGEKHQRVVVSHTALTPTTGDLAHNPGMCPDWESNLWTFGSQANTQSTEPHQPGVSLTF